MSDKFYLNLEEEIKAEENSSFDDEEIVLKSLENPRLFGVFVDKYQDVFLRTVMKILKRKEESEDVVQEAFVKIYFNVKKYRKRPSVKFKSWAFKILLNCAFTRYRRMKKSFGDTEYMDEILYLQNEKKLSDFSFEKKEKRDEIESVLGRMPEEMGDLIKEHYLEDKPYVEIASSKDMSIPALKMKLFRARKMFREVWKTN